MKIAIVGCGNMGLAFAKSFLKYELVLKEDLLLIEKSKARCEFLRKEREGLVVETINEDLGNYDLVILSVKPQDFHEVAQELKTVIQPQQLVLSIMAGMPIKKIQKELNHKEVVRAMPNSPALIGKGITGYCVSKGISFQKMQKVDNLINATGRSVYIEDEDLMDAVTALSGSGPAYFYYMVKHMIEAGKKMGFTDSMAGLLVKQTMIGAYHLINNAEKNLDELIATVASKGGTTEAALKTFEELGVGTGFEQGIQNAEKRSKELSKF